MTAQSSESTTVKEDPNAKKGATEPAAEGESEEKSSGLQSTLDSVWARLSGKKEEPKPRPEGGEPKEGGTEKTTGKTWEKVDKKDGAGPSVGSLFDDPKHWADHKKAGADDAGNEFIDISSIDDLFAQQKAQQEKEAAERKKSEEAAEKKKLEEEEAKKKKEGEGGFFSSMWKKVSGTVDYVSKCAGDTLSKIFTSDDGKKTEATVKTERNLDHPDGPGKAKEATLTNEKGTTTIKDGKMVHTGADGTTIERNPDGSVKAEGKGKNGTKVEYFYDDKTGEEGFKTADGQKAVKGKDGVTRVYDKDGKPVREITDKGETEIFERHLRNGQRQLHRVTQSRENADQVKASDVKTNETVTTKDGVTISRNSQGDVVMQHPDGRIVMEVKEGGRFFIQNGVVTFEHNGEKKVIKKGDMPAGVKEQMEKAGIKVEETAGGVQINGTQIHGRRVQVEEGVVLDRTGEKKDEKGRPIVVQIEVKPGEDGKPPETVTVAEGENGKRVVTRPPSVGGEQIEFDPNAPPGDDIVGYDLDGNKTWGFDYEDMKYEDYDDGFKWDEDSTTLWDGTEIDEDGTIFSEDGDILWADDEGGAAEQASHTACANAEAVVSMIQSLINTPTGLTEGHLALIKAIIGDLYKAFAVSIATENYDSLGKIAGAIAKSEQTLAKGESELGKKTAAIQANPTVTPQTLMKAEDGPYTKDGAAQLAMKERDDRLARSA